MKGAPSKQLFRWAAQKAIAKGNSPVASRYALLRGSMAWHILYFVELCDHRPIILTPVDAASLQEHGRAFLSLYQHLREWASVSGRSAYHVRPKLHYFAELVEDLTVTRENPRRQDLFNAESFLGKIKNVGRKVHRRKAPQRICQRRRLHLLSRWQKRGH